MTPPPNEVEVGWLVLGRLDAIDRAAVQAARDRTHEIASRQLSGVEWRMPILERRDLGQDERVEATDLVERGIDERDGGHLDLVLAVTGAELVGYGHKPYALAAVSRAAGVGVLSTARIDPHARGEEVDRDERQARLARRLTALALHLVGDLVGISHDGAPGSAMTVIESIETLDAIEGYTEETRADFSPALREIADIRLEEVRRPPKRLLFYLRASRMNVSAIVGSCWRASPWKLPFRLSRLSAAAVSAVVVFLISAEAWQLAMYLDPAAIVALVAVSLLATVIYIIKRQQLLMSHSAARITEQIVIADVSVAITVSIGLLVAYSMLFLLTLIAGSALLPAELVSTWAGAQAVGIGGYLRFAGFVAAIGLTIGAMGASFESQSYFRHVTYIDEELG